MPRMHGERAGLYGARQLGAVVGADNRKRMAGTPARTVEILIACNCSRGTVAGHYHPEWQRKLDIEKFDREHSGRAGRE